ncbi:MAG: alpha/beta hydrolase [bacterium]|nr:alpha/beta hydrolase [bacterium]
MRPATRLGIALGVLVGALGAVVWSWTFTPLGRLDLQAAIIAKMSSLFGDTDMDMSPEARAAANDMTRSMLADGGPDARVASEDRTVAGPGGEIPVRIYTPPSDEPLPFYLNIHGGGWWMGNGYLMDGPVRALAGAVPAIVVSVDYRLAPEHPYPAGLEDCEAVLRWIADEGASLGGDPTRIAIGGASAGGNLSAALALKARDAGGPAIAAQYLNVPATDLSGTREWHSFDEAYEGYVLTVPGIERMIEAYVPDPRQRMEPYVSPLLEGRLQGLPPALVVTALFDPLRDQGEAYARRLEAAGVPVTLHREDALHGFLGSPERADRVDAMAVDFVRRALHP